MARKKKDKLDKHAVPVLDNNIDFYSMFGADIVDANATFDELIKENLSDVDVNQALQEKLKAQDQETHKPQKKYPPPEAKLDLHGCTGPEAEGKTDRFIQAAIQRGLSTLCIVTGKGIHSEGEGVLRNLIENRLVALKQDRVIASFRWEKKTKHKSGAVIVYLP